MPVEIMAAEERRPALPAIVNGIRCRCPRCGEGKLFRAYLKVDATCPNCGEELHHHRADDMPPYISIFIVGHLIVGIMLHLEMTARIEPIWYVVTAVPAALLLPLLLLPSIKGAVVGLQWANRMHGFDPAEREGTAT